MTRKLQKKPASSAFFRLFLLLTLKTGFLSAQCNNLFTFGFLSAPATCGVNDGTIGITNVTGGTGVYTFSLNAGAQQGPTIPPNNHSFTNLGAGNYQVTISDGNCDTTVTVVVSVNGSINSAQVTTTPETCSGAPGSATITALPAGITITSYTLNPGGTVNATGQFTGLSAGTYSCVILDNGGCTFTVNNIVVSTPDIITDADITVNDVQCKGALGSIVVNSVSGGTSPYTYALNGAGNSAVASFTDLFAGIYSVTVTDANNCTYTESVVLNGSTTALTDCNAGKDVTIFFGENTQLTAIKGVGKIVGWEPAEFLSDSTSITPIAFPPGTTTFKFTTVTPEGCICEDLVTVTVIPLMNIPNTFTPNGDGKNDKWIIDKINLYEEVTVTIYNRWGDKVFESEGYPPGEEFDGGNLPTATYYFIIRFKYPAGEETYEYPGAITIVR